MSVSIESRAFGPKYIECRDASDQIQRATSPRVSSKNLRYDTRNQTPND